MTYNKVHPGGWHDAPDNTTPINADALNTIEQGIADAAVAADVAAQLGTKAPLPSGSTPGFVATVGSDGNSITYAAASGGGGGGGLTVVDNGDGTLTFTSGGSSTVTDNLDGTLTFS